MVYNYRRTDFEINNLAKNFNLKYVLVIIFFMKDNILEIKPCIKRSESSVHFNLDFKSIKILIEKVISKNIAHKNIEEKVVLENLLRSIPFISYSNFISKTFSFTIICSTEDFDIIEDFISEVLHKKLNKKRSLEILEKHSSLFKFSNFSSNKFYIMEYFINFEKRELPIIKDLIFYLKLFIDSIQNIKNILDKKAEENIFREFYHIITLFNSEFITKQKFTYINKIINSCYSLNTKLLQKKNKNQRHILLRSISPKDSNLLDHRLGIVLSMNILKETERFGKLHIINAIENYSSNINFVEESFIERKDNSNLLFFFEIEKSTKELFYEEEKKLLEEKLKIEIENGIEHIIPYVVTKKNEEEILKNIVLLSKQIRYVDDIPQVILNYKKQTASHLIFSVILIRILKKSSISIEKSFLYSDTCLNFIPDDIKIVGNLKKYKKEANIFKISVKKESFYRKDFSLDSQKARIEIAIELEKIIGKFRDYNGSLIKQQIEAFDVFRNTLEKKLKNSIKVEKFFYSLKPTTMQLVIESKILKKMFSLISQIKITEDFVLKTSSIKNWFLIAIGASDSSFKEPIKQMIDQLKLSSFDIATCQLNDKNNCISGYIIKYKNIETHPLLHSKFLNTMNRWQKQNCSFKQLNTDVKNLLSIFSKFPKSFKQKEEKEQLKISLQNDPLTLDPRKSGDIFSSSILFMLFSGLTEFKEDGSIFLNLAKNIKISKDKKIYIFYLKDNIRWSDGKEITAYDFEKSWKKMLDPDFPSPSKYLLYPVLNAEKASQGKIVIEKVGIKSINDKILEVTLSHPAPYFLSATAFCSLFPVPKHMEKQKNISINNIINNGPFLIKKWVKNKEIVLKKNPFYWNAEKIILDSIHISIVKDEKHNLEMLKKGKIDWAGSLLSPLPNNILNIRKPLNVDLKKQQEPVGGTTFCFFNTDKFPFNNKNIRKAFGLAIDRKKIVREIKLSHDQIATRCIPPSIVDNKNLYLINDNDVKSAKILFEKGLKELKEKKENLKVVFTCKNEKFDKIQSKILKETWEKTFDINIELEYLSQKTFHKELNKHEMQLAVYYWLIQYNDPMDILERFKNKTNTKNYSNWENKEYQELIKKAKITKDIKKRKKIIEETEKLFIEDMPISPLYHHEYLMIAKENIKGIFIGPLGEIHFNKAYFK